jgi:hypothetical protein
MKKIAILFHENDRKRTLNYLIMRLAELWRAEGMEVIKVFGTKQFVHADLAILHVDLSVVPDKYIEFAQQYPIVLNGNVRNIRKSTFTDNLVLPDNRYEGKVIVKSDLNHAGAPERLIYNFSAQELFLNLKRKLGCFEILGRVCSPHFNCPSDYIILESSSLIPRNWYKSKNIVIQKFLPEIDQGYYCIRNYYFLGDRSTCVLRKASQPIVNAGSTLSLEPTEVHPEIVELRRKLRFDYGKFDYIVHEGIPVLIDINKTPAASPGLLHYVPMHPNLAEGVHSYFS